MGRSFDRPAYMKEYLKNHTVDRRIRFGKETDAEMLAYIDQQPDGFSKYVRRLIREDMEKHKSNNVS